MENNFMDDKMKAYYNSFSERDKLIFMIMGRVKIFNSALAGFIDDLLVDVEKLDKNTQTKLGLLINALFEYDESCIKSFQMWAAYNPLSNKGMLILGMGLGGLIVEILYKIFGG